MSTSKIIIGIGLILSIIIVGVAAYTTIYLCDDTGSDYDEDICRPHLYNPSVALTFALDYFLLLALTFISFVIIKYNIANILKTIIQRTIKTASNKNELKSSILNIDIKKQDDIKIFNFHINVIEKGEEKNGEEKNGEKSIKIIGMYVMLSVIITLPTAFILLQYTSTQFFDAVGISSYTKWFLINDKDTILSNVFFTYLDNVAFVILGIGALWVFLIRYVNKKQKNPEKFTGVSKLQNYLYISIVLVAAGVAVYAIDSYNITTEETLSETIIFEENLRTDHNVETITTAIVTKKTVETLDNENAFKMLQDKLSLALYEPESSNAVVLRLGDTIMFLIAVSAFSGVIVSLFEIHVINRIDSLK